MQDTKYAERGVYKVVIKAPIETLEQWIATKKSGAAKHGEMVKLVKADHGMTHGFANLVAHKTLKSDSGSGRGRSFASRRTSL